MPKLTLRHRPDWTDARPVLSTNRVAGLLGVGWPTALELMASGRIRSRRIGVKSQAYYRTSMRDVRAYLDGEPVRVAAREKAGGVRRGADGAAPRRPGRS